MVVFFPVYFLHKRKIIKQEISSVSLRVDEKYSGNVFKGHCFVKAHRTKYKSCCLKKLHKNLALYPKEFHDMVVT